jgi:hypothetical protein
MANSEPENWAQKTKKTSTKNQALFDEETK